MRVDQILVDTVLTGKLVIERTENTVRTWLVEDADTVMTVQRRGPRTHKRTPIGSRNTACLTARMNQQELDLTVGRGHITKRSYRVTVTVADRTLSLSPWDTESSLFINGKPHEIEHEFCEFTARDKDIAVLWAIPRTVLNRHVQPPEPTPEDLVVGYALAAAFGTGSLSLTSIIMGFVGAVFP